MSSAISAHSTDHELLPWTQEAFDSLVRSQGRQAHAYLLAGHSGLGKKNFAIQLAKSMLCHNSATSACASCQSCNLFESGTHPDLHVLQSEKRSVEVEDVLASYSPRYLEDESKRKKRKKPSAVIAIDQVRKVIPDINSRPHLAKCRIVIINGAEDLNINAANSLLKSLEEPPADSFFLLISHDPGRLLPTIRSRCLRIDFRVPEKQQALAWLTEQLAGRADASALLEHASGIPLRALTLADADEKSAEQQVKRSLIQLAEGKLDPVTACAELIKNYEMIDILSSIQGQVGHIIRLKFIAAADLAGYPGDDKVLINIGNRLDFKQLYAFLDKVSESKQLAGGPLDDTLALEADLISWQQLSG